MLCSRLLSHDDGDGEIALLRSQTPPLPQPLRFSRRPRSLVVLVSLRAAAFLLHHLHPLPSAVRPHRQPPGPVLARQDPPPSRRWRRERPRPRAGRLREAGRGARVRRLGGPEALAGGGSGDGQVEEEVLQQEDEEDVRVRFRGREEAEGGFVEFHRLHKREEELYFYDAFAYPWEKDKHYKMVYQLEKKYFPEHCLDKAFLEPGESGGTKGNAGAKGKKDKRRVNEGKEKMEDKKLVFFEEEEKKDGDDLTREEGEKDVMEKKVEEFFKCLKKVPSEKNAVTEGEPYVLTRSTELPPRWDGPHGTVVLINKPKGGSLTE